MSDRPKIEWTNDELRKAWGVTREKVPLSEAAAAYAVSSALGAVHPAECREREREAFDAGVSDCHGGMFHPRSTACLRERDRRYPSLTPPSPPALTLSTGEWKESHDGVWMCAVGNASGTFTGCIGMYVRTASDARALAEWLAQYGSDDERK